MIRYNRCMRLARAGATPIFTLVLDPPTPTFPAYVYVRSSSIHNRYRYEYCSHTFGLRSLRQQRDIMIIGHTWDHDPMTNTNINMQGLDFVGLLLVAGFFLAFFYGVVSRTLLCGGGMCSSAPLGIQRITHPAVSVPVLHPTRTEVPAPLRSLLHQSTTGARQR